MRFVLLLTLLFLSSCQVLRRMGDTKSIIKIDNQVFDAIQIDPIHEQTRNIIYDTISSMPSFRRLQIEDNHNNSVNLIRQKSLIVENKQNKRNTTTSGGQIIYSVPDTMQVAKNYQVIVRISSCQKNIEI